ncbi:MAG: hypothetical protein QOF73_5373, partial [Thermomicrobiales bacterium]|nr:hypothetical protein [Thermomicrobiales bacterium]
MEEFAHRGSWWLPERPDRRLTGTLTYTFDEGLNLDLDGLLSDTQIFGGPTFPVVHGIADRRSVTLGNCRLSRFGSTVAAGPWGALSVETAIFDVLIPPEMDRFRTGVASFGFGHLHDWALVSGITEEITFDEQGTSARLALSYDAPEPVTATLPGYTFQFPLGLQTGGRRPGEFRWTESLVVKV